MQLHRTLAFSLALTFMPLAACGSSTPAGSGTAASATSDAAAKRLTGDEAVKRVLDAIEPLPEVAALKKRMEADGVSLIAMLENEDAANPSPSTYQVYVGESHATHTVRLWAFNVNATTGEMTVTDPVTLEEHSFATWKQRLTASPP